MSTRHYFGNTPIDRLHNTTLHDPIGTDNIEVSTLQAAGASCKSCSHFNSPALMCRCKSKRVAAYNICHLHNKDIIK